MDWSHLNWKGLQRLRALFLDNPTGRGVYWTSREDLAAYDVTFGARIGWKWQAVFDELDLRGWSPSSGTVLDWGCGSGIAGRALLHHYGIDRFRSLKVADHSGMASEYAAEMARTQFPEIKVNEIDLSSDHPIPPVNVLLLSHVLNELTSGARKDVLSLIRKSDCVIWVEPGTREVNRDLISFRETLRETFNCVAPCTHQNSCPMLSAEHERHWCHHFAKPPSHIFADPDWARFSHTLNIDLRSVPYSFLVMEKKALTTEFKPGFSRIIGKPREYKGYCKILSCQEAGLEDLMLQKRDCPELFKTIQKDRQLPVYKWLRKEDRIVGTST